MKNLLILITIMLVGGCATTPTKELTAEEKALRDSVVGEYEYKVGNFAEQYVFLDNGVFEWYENGKKQEEYKWSIVKGEIHVGVPELKSVYRINLDKSLTRIGTIKGGKRPDYLGTQWTFIKIK